jgi:hypothetical protein
MPTNGRWPRRTFHGRDSGTISRARSRSPGPAISSPKRSSSSQLICLKSAQRSRQDRDSYAAPRGSLDKLTNGVLAFRGPAFFHVDEERRTIVGVTVTVETADYISHSAGWWVALGSHNTAALVENG